MSRFQTAGRATVSEQAKMNPFFSIIRRVLHLESLCMSMPHSKGSDDLSCQLSPSRLVLVVDERMPSSSDIGSSKSIFSRLHRLAWCIRSEYKPSFFLPSRQKESAQVTVT